MKIGYDAKRYFNNTTGLGNYARWLVDGISQRTDVHPILFHTKTVSDSSFEVIYPTGIYSKLKGLWRSKFICSDIETNGIDIYHGLSNELPFGIHKLNVKTVVTIHDLINLRYPEHYKKIDLLIYKAKLRYAIRYADTIVTPSNQTKSDIIQYFQHKKDNIVVIPLSTPAISSMKSKSTVTDPYILCVSSFTQRKNLASLVKAFEKIKKPNIKLIIAGKKGETYDNLASISKGNKNIRLMTDVSTNELTNLYQNSLFCIYPSLFEGFGIPILESFMHHKTIATSDISSMPEVGGNAAIYFDPNSVDEICNSIKTLLVPANRKNMESKITEQLKHFDSGTLIARYLSVYKDSLNQI